MKNFSLIATILLIFSSCDNSTDKFKILDYMEFKNQIVNNVQLVDVRTSEEFNAGHIEGAINIDFKNEELFYQLFKGLDKKNPVYVYCRSGNRSKKSADKLLELGFSKVYDLKGGYIEWNLNELKVN
ncbi:MAG: rhodanese-like domain-containing protein [Flavobacteriaceae bacterium]|nr:rhodanese-like domain-containing protein [Flavobacteriaceae bacterium]